MFPFFVEYVEISVCYFVSSLKISDILHDTFVMARQRQANYCNYLLRSLVLERLTN